MTNNHHDNLDDLRGRIDAIDDNIRMLLLERQDLSQQVALEKIKQGNTIVYRPDREAEQYARLVDTFPNKKMRTHYKHCLDVIIKESRAIQQDVIDNRL